MASASSFFLAFALVFLASGTVLTGSLGYAQLNGLSLTGDTYTVNFVITGLEYQQAIGYGDQWFQYETGHFDQHSVTIDPGDSVHFIVPLGSQVDGNYGFYQCLWTVELGVSAIGGNTNPDSTIPGEYNVNQYGVASADVKLTFPAAGTYEVHFNTYLMGTYGGPGDSLIVNVVAPPVEKTMTVGVSGQGRASGGLTSAIISDPARWRFDVRAGEANVVKQYPMYSQLDFTAVANSGYKFSHWVFNDGTTSTDSSISLILDKDMSALAVFSSQGVLTAVSSGNGYFTIFPGVTDPHKAQDYVYAGQTKSFQHDAGNTIEVAAFANSGAQFDHWVLPDGSTSTSKTVSFTMPSSGTITAYFVVAATIAPTAPPSVPVDVTFNIGSIGTIEWNDLTSGAGGTISKTQYPLGSATVTVNQGDTLRVNGKPGTNYQFVKFDISGVGIVTSTPYEFTVSGATTVSAYFTSVLNPTATPSPTEVPWTPSPTESPTQQPTVEPTPIPTSTPEPTVPPTASPTPTATATPNPSSSATPQPTEQPKPYFWIPKEYRLIAWIGGFASLGLSGLCFVFYKATKPHRRF